MLGDLGARRRGDAVLLRLCQTLAVPAIVSCDAERGVCLVSLGYGGTARLVLGDGKSAVYAYGCTNLNKQDNDPREDGEIYVESRSIVSVYVPKKTKRHPNGVPIKSAENVDYEKMIAVGSLKVTNCSSASRLGGGGVDVQAWELIRKIALRIQMDGSFPEKVGYFK